MHAFNPRTRGAKSRWVSGFEASLAYKVSSRTARTVHTEKPFLEKNVNIGDKTERTMGEGEELLKKEKGYWARKGKGGSRDWGEAKRRSQENLY